MATGGLKVGIVGTEGSQMIAVAQNFRELIEIRKFAVNMEEVLSVKVDQTTYPGNHITWAEAHKYNLKKPDDPNEDL